jgi:outer membrane protein OmpA-like peptidoglycan-associated protein
MATVVGKIWLCLLLAAGIGWMMRHLLGSTFRISSAGGPCAEYAIKLRECEGERNILLAQIDNAKTLAARNESTIRELTKRVNRLLLEQWHLANITFPVDSAEITASAAARLEQALPLILGLENEHIVVCGHTDTINSEEYNLDLSRRRAEVVKNYLIGRGVDASLLTAEGYGGSQPIADNAVDEGRMKNRRIELLIQKGT